MKKIFIFCCMFYAFKVSALSPDVIYQNNIYSNRLDSNNKIHSGLMAFIFMEDNIVYCLDPYKIVSNNYAINNGYHIDEDDLEYFKLVAYYGYNKNNRNSIYYYMAAQELIWERILGGDKVFWTTGQYNEGERINIDSYKNEIINNINNFNTIPSFSYSTYSININEDNYIIDNNNVVNSYLVKDTNDAIISKSNNKLIIRPISTYVPPIYLYRSIKLNTDATIVYASDNGQTLASFGGELKKNIKLNIEVIFDKNVYIRFFDSETKKIKYVDFNVCELSKDWYKHDNGYYTYPDKVKDGTYNLCGLEEYEPMSFDINSTNTEDVYLDIYLERKDKTFIDEDFENYDSNEIEKSDEKEKNISKKIEEPKIENVISKKIIDSNIDSIINNKNIGTNLNEVENIKYELPNTYDYESIFYLFLILVIWINILYEIKN